MTKSYPLPICNRVGCSNPGTLSPVLECFAPILRPHPPIEIAIGLRCCPEHATTNPEDLCSDTLWEMICKIARAQGKMVPKRSRTKVKWVASPNQEKLFGVAIPRKGDT